MLHKGKGGNNIPELGMAQAVLDSLSGHIAVLDRSGRIVAVNAAWKELDSICNYAPGFKVSVGDNYFEAAALLPPERRRGGRVCTRLKDVLTGLREEYSFEYPAAAGGGKRWFRLSARAIADGSSVVGIVLTLTDITPLRHTELQIKRLAVTDTMTGLLNRNACYSLLNRLMRRSRKYGLPLTVCYIDLDDLKNVNDTFGHREGDRVIKAAARLVKSVIREGDAVCRMGGDELLIVLPGCGAGDAEGLLGRVKALFGRLNDKKMLPSGIDFSYGLAEYDAAAGVDAGELVHTADKAMYSMKSAKKNRHGLL